MFVRMMVRSDSWPGWPGIRNHQPQLGEQDAQMQGQWNTTDRPTAFPPPTSEAGTPDRFGRAIRATSIAFLSRLATALRRYFKEEPMSKPRSNNSSTRGKGNIVKPSLPSPGQRPRNHRAVTLWNALVEEARREGKTEAESLLYAKREFERRKNWSRSKSGKDTGYRLPTSKASEYPDFVKIKALRESDIGRTLTAMLRSGPKLGRPTEHNMAIALLEMMLWSGEYQTLTRCHSDMKKADKTIPYTYGPGAQDFVAFNTACNAIGGERRSDGLRRPGLCDLISEDFIDRALVEVAKRFATYAGEDFDLAVSIDGTRIRASAEQRQSFSDEDEEHIDKGRGTGFSSRGENDALRGYLAVSLNLQSCNIPIAVKVYPANQYETSAAMPLIDRVYELWDDLAINYLVGDAAFDRDASIYRDLQQRYGITLVARKYHADKMPAHLKERGFEKGVPVCGCSGEGKKSWMKLHKSEGFWPPEKRRKMGLKPGEDAAALKRFKKVKQRVCYECERCGLQVPYSISEEVDWRWALPIPHHPVHEKRHALRCELMAAHNTVESAWNAMKKSGVDAERSDGAALAQLRPSGACLHQVQGAALLAPETVGARRHPREGVRGGDSRRGLRGPSRRSHPAERTRGLVPSSGLATETVCPAVRRAHGVLRYLRVRWARRRHLDPRVAVRHPVSEPHEFLKFFLQIVEESGTPSER
ncbi:MAG: hypothetical protein V9E83_09235 [Baekduia sp.]